MNTRIKLSGCVFLLLLLLLPFRLFCQLFEWTTPVPLTDSLTDNRNALVMGLNFYDGWDHYVFWEKSFDTNSTHIFARKYYGQDDPVALTDGDHHYINPCILKLDWIYPPGEPYFYLFYISDQDGDFDIYYRTYSTSGFSEPVAFTSTNSDEKNLRSNGATGLTWEYNGKIIYSSIRNDGGGPYYFTDAVVVDSGNCKKPVLDAIPNGTIGEKYLAWEKEINDSSRVMLSEWGYAGDNWLTPQMIYNTGHNTNLRFEESTFSEVWPTLSWESVDATGYRKVICYDPIYLDFFTLDMEQQQEYFPTVFNIFVGVSDIWFFALLSFIKEENGLTEVYGGEQSNWPESYLNLSNSSAIETNTHLWNGMMYSYEQDVINIWESNRNGHWQLFSSRILVPIAGSVSEVHQNKQVLIGSPNPFTNQVTLSFKSDIAGKSRIILYDETGRQIGILSEPEFHKGEQSWVINPEKITGRKLPAGIYFIRLQFEGKSFSVKLVKSGI